MFGLILSVLAVIMTISAGVITHMRGIRGSKRGLACVVALSFLMLLAGAALSFASTDAAFASDAEGVDEAKTDTSNNGIGYISMALVTGMACIGAGVAVGTVGTAALGLIGERPDSIGATLIYVGLAEGIAIYGIVVSILILNKLG